MGKGTLIVLMSPAGGAKSVIANYLGNTKDNCVVVSRKQMERATGHFDEIGTWQSYSRFYDVIDNHLLNSDYVVANDYHVTYSSRKQLLDNISNAKQVIGIWIEVPENIALQHNKDKKLGDQVEDSYIRATFQYAESPREDEDFDDVIFISKDTLTSGIGVSKTNPNIQDMYKVLDQI